MEDRIKASETHLFKVVFPPVTNHYDTLFGGITLQLMDEAAFIAATRYTRMRMVTVSSDKVEFKKAIPGGVMVEAIARVETVGKTSLKVKVEIFMEEMYSDKRELVVDGYFSFVALDEHHQKAEIK
jgi:acyl-CoA hydrolase